MFQIDKGDRNQGGDQEQEVEGVRQSSPKFEKDKERRERGDEFDDRILNRNSFPTRTATSPEQNKTQQRDIIKPTDHLITVGTMRPRLNNRELPWEAIDTDIEKTTDQEAKNEESRRYQ